MTIDQLNDKYFGIYGELYKARAYLPERQYDSMCRILQQEYSREVELIVNDNVLETAGLSFEQRYLLANYIPRRRFLFYNKLARVLFKKYSKDFKLMLEELKKENATTETAVAMLEENAEDVKEG